MATEGDEEKHMEYRKPVPIPFKPLPDLRLDYREPRVDRTGRHGVMRIATWNVLNRHEDFIERFEQCCRFLYMEDVDVAMLQEIPLEFRHDARDAAFRSGFTLTVSSMDSDGTDLDSVPGILIRRDAYIVPRHMEEYGADGGETGLSGEVEKRLSYHSFLVDAMIGKTIPVTFVSRHGAWGATEQAARLAEAKSVERWLTGRNGKYSDGFDSEPIVIMGGDFNATRNEPSQRYLLDGEAGGGAFWIDVQDMRLDADSSYDAKTTFRFGCADDTASAHGIDVEYMPSRRIDYLMTRGWRYGRLGGFTDDVIDPVGDWERLTGERDGIMLVSDHKPIIADILIN